MIIDVVAGARPNFVKVAPIFREIDSREGAIAARFVHTGQHYDEEMSAVFLRELGIPQPEVNLGVGSGTHSAQTARLLEAYEGHLLSNGLPRATVVVGDVNSTMACTLVAVKEGVPVVHVEAGLRSFDRSMPEEINRIVTDSLADLLLVSAPEGEENLLREGVSPGRIRYVGNVMIDSLVWALPAARQIDIRTRVGLGEGPFAYVTLHRPSNVDTPECLKRHLDLLSDLAERLPVVFVLHPRTKNRLERFGLLQRLDRTPGLHSVDAIGYLDSIALIDSASVIITDSGGLQEEASFLGVPCVTLRSSTERPVTVTLGTNTLAGCDDPARALSLVDRLLANPSRSGRPIPGWDGLAARRIVDALEASFVKG